MVETIDILSETIGQEETTMIKNGVDSIIKNITD
jgi:hypothetical protein